jgi:chromosome segregation ATPase
MTQTFLRLPVSFRIFWRHRKSGLFDYTWYMEQNPDVRATTKRPFLHFVRHGVFEGRPPHTGFDALAYLAANPDVLRSGLPATLHYALHGHQQRRHLIPPPSAAEERLQSENNILAKENRELNEEHGLILLQLHQVQEELEKYFHENRKLQDAQQKLAALDSEHSELVTRHSTLATVLEELRGQHTSLSSLHALLVGERDGALREGEELKAKVAELSKKRQDLEAKAQILVMERDQARGEREQIDASLKALAAERSDLRMKAVDADAKNEYLTQEIKETRTELAKLVAQNKSLFQELQKVQGELVKKASENSQLQDRQKSALAVRQDLETKIRTLTQKCDQARSERDAKANERDALKKIASDRAMRIAELEAQVADQANRQKQITEEMAKTEGQIEMLKDLLAPTLR